MTNGDLDSLLDLALKQANWAAIGPVWQRHRTVLSCQNCGVLSVEDPEQRHSYRYYAPADSWPKVFVDRSVCDALGGYSLDHPQSQSDISAQRVLLDSGVGISAYDNAGWQADCTIGPWLNPDDTYDESRWAARPDEN